MQNLTLPKIAALDLTQRLDSQGESTLPAIGQWFKNSLGHDCVRIIGRNLTGAQEITCLSAAGKTVYPYAQSTLESLQDDSYDANHRLNEGQVYTLVLMPTNILTNNRAERCLLKKGVDIGYAIAPAGTMPTLCEILMDEQRKAMGFWWIVGSHETIRDSDGVALRFALGYGSSLDADWDGLGVIWRGDGAVVFLVPQGSPLGLVA